jgi:hypothetical protein
MREHRGNSAKMRRAAKLTMDHNCRDEHRSSKAAKKARKAAKKLDRQLRQELRDAS